MSNNVPDHEDNLVFPPETRSYEARLEEKLKIAEEALHTYANLLYDGSVKGYESIAKEALKKIKE